MLLNSHNILDESLTQSEPSAQPVYYGFFMCRRDVMKYFKINSKKKFCYKCKKEKYLHEFSNNKSKKDGKADECKACSKILAKEKRLKFPEKIREKKKLEYARNRDKRLKQKHEYQVANREKIHATKFRYRQTEHGKNIVRENNKRYFLKYPNRKIIISMVREAVYSGKLIRPKFCELCNLEKKSESHHYSYDLDKALDVIWLHRQCHRKTHIEKIPKSYFDSKRLYREYAEQIKKESKQ